MNKQNLQRLLLPAFAVLFGMQSLRLMFALLLAVIRDRIGYDAIQLGLLALAIFSTSFLVALLNRFVGTKRALWIAGGGLAFFRLGIQLWTGDPLVDFILASLATVFFLWFVPIYVGSIRREGEGVLALTAVSLLLGFAFDTALHGLYLTYDFAWQSGWTTAVLMIALTAVFLWLLFTTPMKDAVDGNVLAWLGWGLFLFLQLLVLQNLASFTSVSEWSYPLGYGWMLLGQVLGVGLVAFWMGNGSGRIPLWLILLTIPIAAYILRDNTAPFGWLLLPAQLIFSLWFGLIILSLKADETHIGLRNLTIVNGITMILFVLFSFLYYAAYDLSLPFANTILLSTAVILVGLATMWAGWVVQKQENHSPLLVQPHIPALVAAALLLLPLIVWLGWETAVFAPPSNTPLRVMTYNIHMGFDMDGHLGLEAIAQEIEAEQPDIIGLQEISRGWVVNGSVDNLVWLSRRLDMPYIFHPVTDPSFGNAVLSRYPITDYEFIPLPPDDLPLVRGLIRAEIDVGMDEPLNFFVTHYHHREAESDIRVTQSEAAIAALPTDGMVVFMGDLNAKPGTPEMVLLEEFGLAEVIESAGITPGYTSSSIDPMQRIDYIWLSSDLQAKDVSITTEPASDHLGVAATVEINE